MSATPPWWQTAVVYQIYPRSFADADGNGIGDLPGILAHLDDLAWLGVDAIWVSPFYPSPMRDFGYDVADYYDVDPVFGTLADFDALVAAAHERGLRVLVDWVPNHSSSDHPWFVAARSSRSDRKRDWYIWRDPGPGGELPNNWTSTFTQGAPAWTLDAATGQLYLHLFLPEQPDLNWANPAVEAAMHDTLRFWLDRGVDGFRMDVIHGIGKDPALPDDPPDLAPVVPHSALNDTPETHELLRRIRKLLDSYPGDRVAVGEVFLLSTAKVAEYYGDGDELHLAFNFPPLFAPWAADAWRKRIARAEQAIGGVGGWPTWVLSNHDNPRHRTRYGGSEPRARAAAVLLLTLRGTPFLYAGEELGLEDAVVPPAQVVDPGGRDGCRAPIPWLVAPPHGWAGADPWLPFPPASGERSWEARRADEGSILHLYRRLLAARRRSPALQRGTLELLPAPDGIVAYRRASEDERCDVFVNMSERAVTLPVSGAVEITSDGQPFAGTLAPDTALLVVASESAGERLV